MKTAADFELTDPAVMECPYDFYTALRRDAPVYKSPNLPFYIVSRYDDIMQALRDVDTFSSKISSMRPNPIPPEIVEIHETEGWGKRREVLLTNDPPEHTLYRSLVDRAFTGKRVRQMEGYMNEIVDQLIDGFIDDGKAEILSQFAVPLPLTVIADQLGVSREDMEKFKEWSDAAVAPLGMTLTREREIECARLIIEMYHYFAERIEERRQNPKDDIISDLVHAKLDSGQPLTEKEILSILQSLLVAGNETTTNAIASGVRLLIENPDQIEKVRSNEKLLRNMVEEILRLESPAQGLFRVVKRDTELGGVHLPKGATINLRYGAGNRDEEKYENAAQMDVDRNNSGSHLAFGAGIHHCIGALLARQEMLCAFRALLDRIDDIQLNPNKPAPVHHPGITFRGLEHLHITFTKR